MSLPLLAYVTCEAGVALMLVALAWRSAAGGWRDLASPVAASVGVTAIGLGGSVSRLHEPGALWPLCGGAVLLGVQTVLLLLAAVQTRGARAE